MTPEAAETPLLAWARARTAALSAEDRAVSAILRPRATTIPFNREALVVFLPVFVAFGLVLLTACANVSNMMLARALARQREIGIRISLGAGRVRLVRQLLTESVLLALPAAAAGSVIAQLTLQAARRILFASVPPAFASIVSLVDLSPDWRVFVFILSGAVGATLAFGLIPAIQTTRSGLVHANRGDFSSDLRPERLRNALVVAQVAICVLLLVSTVIVVRTEGRMTAMDLGMNVHGVYDVRVTEKYQAAVAARLAREPGVEAVAEAWHAPLYGSLRRIAVVPSGGKETTGIAYNFVSPGYFAAFRIPLRKGRIPTEEEAAANAPLVVISESAARRLWPNREALGESIAIPPRRLGDPYYDRAPLGDRARVIGVVRDTLAGMIANGRDVDCIYFTTSARATHNDSVLVRIGGDGAARGGVSKPR